MDPVLVFVVLALVRKALVALTTVVVVVLFLVVSKRLAFPLKVKWAMEMVIMIVLDLDRGGVFLRMDRLRHETHHASNSRHGD